MKHKKSELLIPLEDCSRELNDDGFSEYDVRLAISRMDEEFTSEQLAKVMEDVLAEQALMSLVDKGIAEMVWDDKKNAFGFRPK